MDNHPHSHLVISSASSSSSSSSTSSSSLGLSALGKRKLASITSAILGQPLRDASYSVFQHCINTITSYNNPYNASNDGIAPYTKLPDITNPQGMMMMNQTSNFPVLRPATSTSLESSNTLPLTNLTTSFVSPELISGSNGKPATAHNRKDTFPRTIDTTVTTYTSTLPSLSTLSHVNDLTHPTMKKNSDSETRNPNRNCDPNTTIMMNHEDTILTADKRSSNLLNCLSFPEDKSRGNGNDNNANIVPTLPQTTRSTTRTKYDNSLSRTLTNPSNDNHHPTIMDGVSTTDPSSSSSLVPLSTSDNGTSTATLTQIFAQLFTADDILYCPELGPSILSAWKEREIRTYHNIHFDRLSRTQLSTGIRGHMRAQLIDWLIDVSNDFLVTLENGMSGKMSIESVYKAIYMIDYMLSYRPVPINELQLLGATALFTATTLEELIAIFQPMDAVVFSGNSFTKSDVVRMQQQLLQTMNWECEVPTPRHWLYPLWLTSGCTSNGWRNDVCNLSRYITELGLLSVDITTLVPSLQAAGAYYYARIVMLHCKGSLPPCILQATEDEKEGKKDSRNTSITPTSDYVWPRELQIIANHPLTAIISTALLYQEKAHRKYGSPESSLKAVYNKYAGTTYGRVAEKYAYTLQAVDITGITIVRSEEDTSLPDIVTPRSTASSSKRTKSATPIITGTTTTKVIPQYVLESLPTIDRATASYPLQESSIHTNTGSRSSTNSRTDLSSTLSSSKSSVPVVTRSASRRRKTTTTIQ